MNIFINFFYIIKIDGWLPDLYVEIEIRTRRKHWWIGLRKRRLKSSKRSEASQEEEDNRDSVQAFISCELFQSLDKRQAWMSFMSATPPSTDWLKPSANHRTTYTHTPPLYFIFLKYSTTMYNIFLPTFLFTYLLPCISMLKKEL